MSERRNVHVQGLWTVVAALVTLAAAALPFLLPQDEDSSVDCPDCNKHAAHSTAQPPAVLSLSDYLRTRKRRPSSAGKTRSPIQPVQAAAGRQVEWTGYVTDLTNRSFQLVERHQRAGNKLSPGDAVSVDSSKANLRGPAGKLRPNDHVRVRGTLQRRGGGLELVADRVQRINRR